MSRFNLDAFNIVAGETSFFVLDSNGKCIKAIGYDCPYAPHERIPKNKKNPIACRTEDCDKVNGDCNLCDNTVRCPSCNSPNTYTNSLTNYCSSCGYKWNLSKPLPIDDDDPIDLTETPTAPVYEKCPFCGHLTQDIREDRDPDGHFCFHCHCTSCHSEWAWSPKQSNGESLDGWSDS